MANNRVVHFEIPADKPAKLTRFYADLFGWTFEKAPALEHEYWLCNTGPDGEGINGAVMQRQSPQQPWMNYVDVPSIEATLEAAVKFGGKVAMPRTPVTNIGAVAAIIDPEGNICGLWEKEIKPDVEKIEAPDLAAVPKS